MFYNNLLQLILHFCSTALYLLLQCVKYNANFYQEPQSIEIILKKINTDFQLVVLLKM